MLTRAVLIEFQRKLLADKSRNEIFHEALRRVVKPKQSVVLDIGAGTGFLSFLASRLGAKRCHLVEYSEILQLARKLARENRVPNLEFHAKHSTEIKTIPVDVIVSETLGNHALEEDIVETLNDARRFLKPDGVLMPCELEHYVVPVTDEALWREINVWDSIGHGIDFRAAQDVGLSNIYVRTLRPGQLKGGVESSRLWDRIDFTKKNALRRSGHAEWKIESPAKIYGLALWWRCALLPDLWLSTNPADPITHWEQVYLPIANPISLESGDTLRAELDCESSYRRGFRQDWKLLQLRGGKTLTAESRSTRNARF